MMDQLDFSDITAVYTVDRNGDLTDMAMTFSLEMAVPVGEDVEPAAMEVSYDMDVAINALGDDVKITFPDFSGFEEVTVPEVAA